MLRSESDRKWIQEKLRRKLIAIIAFVWRRLLIRTKFIVISGSVGKTTTKEFLSDILEQRYPIVRTPGNWNHSKFGGLEATIIKARPWHRFAVVEAGIEKPGDMRSAARLLKPDIVVMLGVRRCHTNTFRTLDAIAQEKAQLLYALNRNAYAVINQDDVHVAQMASKLKCNVIRFGSEGAEYRLYSAESRWPARLTLEVESMGSPHKITTQLVGTHWAPTVLGAFATATLCGVPTETAINTISTIKPFWARMQPITLPSIFATVLRDDWIGSIDTFKMSFKVMEEAEAVRKIVVFSDYSDTNKAFRSRANYLGRAAARIADLAIFVGEYADRSARTAIAEGIDPRQAHAFHSVSGATDFLKGELQKGDLVLIKGKTSHHLSRVHLGLIGDLQCDKTDCPKQILCDRCPELGFRWRPELGDYMASPESYV